MTNLTRFLNSKDCLFDMTKNKINVHQTIWVLIEKDLSIKKSLIKNIVNLRALANYFIEENNLQVSVDSVISAIRRYQENLSPTKTKKQISNLFKNSTIKTRNNVVSLSLMADAPLLEWFNLDEVKKKKIKVITGKDKTILLLHNALIDSALKHFPKKYILQKKENLSEIIFTLSKEAIQTKGVLARIAGELALHDINIEELIISPPEFALYVKSSDLIKAHEALFKLNGKFK